MAELRYDALPWCLRRYVDAGGWNDFRDMQKKAFHVIMDTESHVLISAGTSSGKTEAALFPVISDLCENPSKSISVLYISPLIALIDDQYDRVWRMLDGSGVDLYSWHGDISASIKRRVIDSGVGILQITPESLENIVNRNHNKAVALFADLRFVIIDEVHAFMNSDRGLHLLCELEAIERMCRTSPRRIGLSATLSDYSRAKEWLKANSDRDVALIEDSNRLSCDLAVMFDLVPPRKKCDADYWRVAFVPHYRRVFDEIDGLNCIVFANNRSTVEEAAYMLKEEAVARRSREMILAHHSSISKEYRKMAEDRMKDPSQKASVVATSTLELGIDVGDLNRVVQLNASNTVSSLVQKLGRSGRRNGTPSIRIFCTSEYEYPLPSGIQADLLKAIAEVELLNEGWIEPVRYSSSPYSLLFQQTLSHIRGRVTSRYSELRNDVLSMYPFRMISIHDYQLMLRSMCEADILFWDGHREVFAIGDAGAAIVGNPDFSGNFRTSVEMDVFYKTTRIGSVQDLPVNGSNVQLAGASWMVKDVDFSRGRIYVEPSSVVTETYWRSGSGDTDTYILKRMRACLEDTVTYGYLDDCSRAALASSREVYRINGLEHIVTEDDGKWVMYPWLGTVQFDTLSRILRHEGLLDQSQPPFRMVLRDWVSPKEIQRMVEAYAREGDPSELVTDEDLRSYSVLGKYNVHIPVDLLRKQFVNDRIDLGIIIGR